MKKLTVFLLLAVLVFPMALTAGAQDVELSLYEGDGFSVGYPTDWIVMDQETIDSVVDLVTSGKIPGMDASSMQNYKAQIEAMNMTVIMADNGGMNFNIIPQNVGQAVTNDDILTQLVPGTLEQYKSVFTGFEVTNEGTKETYGDNEFVVVGGQYTLMNTSMELTQMMYAGGTYIYIITFTVTETAETDLEAAKDIIATIATSFYVP